MERIYLVGPRPIRREDGNSLDGYLIIQANSLHEAEPSKEQAMRRSWKLHQHVQGGKCLSSDIITPREIGGLIKRGAIDARPFEPI